MPRARSPDSLSRTPAHARQVAKEFGRRLKAVRVERMGQEAFADALGVSRTTVSNIERGTQRVFLDQAYRAAEILAVPIDRLLPPQETFIQVIVRTAADDPLPAAKERRLEKLVREMTVKYQEPKGDD